MKKVIFYIVFLGLVFGFGFVGGCYFRPQTTETVNYVPLPAVRVELPKDSLRVVAERLPERVEVPERVRNASTSLSDRTSTSLSDRAGQGVAGHTSAALSNQARNDNSNQARNDRTNSTSLAERTLRDTLYIMQSIDTLALIRDYILARDYRLTVIDNDTVGKCIVFATVQYNEITRFSAEFTPVQRIVTASTAGRGSTWFDFAHQPSLTNRISASLNDRRIEPFLSLGYLGGSTSLTDRSGLMLGGGCFYRHIGAEYQYVIKENGHYFGVKYKF
ncbi:MAG: hypothetical protein LBN27_05040 [Prevotellaceae bacterium]|jgi:hypothetical protein|nr:hypothetical protein [Prevotellaceae bacterium]